MTTLVDRVNQFYVDSGRSACTQQYMTGRSASDMYNGTARPEFWLIVLAVVNPEVAAETAVTLLQAARVDAGATGEFETDLLSVTASSTDWGDRRRRSKKRDRGVGARCSLQNGYLHLLEFLRTRDARHMQSVAGALAQCDMQCTGKTIAEARTALYALLRSEVDEATFKGEYT